MIILDFIRKIFGWGIKHSNSTADKKNTKFVGGNSQDDEKKKSHREFGDLDDNLGKK